MTRIESLPMSSEGAAPAAVAYGAGPAGVNCAPKFGGGEREQGGLLAAGTFSVWMGTLAIGVAGFLLPYPRAHARPKEQSPVVAKTILVAPIDDAAPPDEADAADPLPPEPQPPALPDPSPPPPAPAAVALDALNPVVAAPAPSPAPAAPSAPTPAVAATPPPVVPTAPARARQEIPARAGPPGPPTVHHLTPGGGAGRRPQPEYPREAIIANQQGTVVVQFTVDETGRVVKAELERPCRWPMLNQAALRVVREKWARFEPGVYDVPFEFKLSEQ
ncbi:MAG: energy transducer TonB [Phycisphaerales bacterium]|nr:energy transducer TonB [Phycisphaerales bacterium]MDB5358013.1 energy transducer TonB [Phycisphaerales bacterium]